MHLWSGILLWVAALAAVATWGATLGHNAWAYGPGANLWPRYVGLHYGRIMLISTLWRPAADGTRAWQSQDWIYDVMGGPESWWAVDYARIGDSYAGTPSYKTVLDAWFIPAWWLAVPFGWFGRVQVRAARRLMRHGRCVRCGYPTHGRPATERCPECGEVPV